MKSESLLKVQNLIFQINVAFSIDFPNIYNDYLLVNFGGFISQVILVNEGDFSRPAPTRFSPLLFMFVLILF